MNNFNLFWIEFRPGQIKLQWKNSYNSNMFRDLMLNKWEINKIPVGTKKQIQSEQSKVCENCTIVSRP